MTTPGDSSGQTGQSGPYPPNAAPPPGQPAHLDDSVVVAIVALLLAGWSAKQLFDLLMRAGSVVPAAAQFLVERPEIVRLLSIGHPAQISRPMQLQRRQNAWRRAAYLVAAARRLSTAWSSPDTGPDRMGAAARLRAAWEAEKRYLSQHVAAQSKRNAAAVAVDQIWRLHGRPDLLGWSARMDERTTAECAAADGRNFDPRMIPPIGYPGTVHMFCRCRAVPAWDTDQRVEELLPGLYNETRSWDGVIAAVRPEWAVRTVHL